MPRFNWKMSGALLATVALVTVSALRADQNDTAGRARISDKVTQTNYQGEAVPETPPIAKQVDSLEPPPMIEEIPHANVPPTGPPPVPQIAPTVPQMSPQMAPAPALHPVPTPYTPAPYSQTPYAQAPMPRTQSCPTGGCSTEGCSTGGCQTMNPGYQQRMSTVLGNGSCCSSGKGGCCLSGGGKGGCCLSGGGKGSCCKSNNNCNQSSGGSCCGSGGGGCCGWWHSQSVAWQQKNAALSRKLFGNCGATAPSGCCGNGCPPMGTYGMVIATNPNHFDARDGKLFGAPGYATPITVPLAPTVHSQFNYGWGMPSSRITPVSNPAGFSSLRSITW